MSVLSLIKTLNPSANVLLSNVGVTPWLVHSHVSDVELYVICCISSESNIFVATSTLSLICRPCDTLSTYVLVATSLASTGAATFKVAREDKSAFLTSNPAVVVYLICPWRLPNWTVSPNPAMLNLNNFAI